MKLKISCRGRKGYEPLINEDNQPKKNYGSIKAANKSIKCANCKLYERFYDEEADNLHEANE